jgi:hypothetical protein
MGQRQIHLLMSGSFIALSMILLLATLATQASASHFGYAENTFKPSLPPLGSTYAVDLDGSAKISGKSIVREASADLVFKVINVKSKGVPSVYFMLVSGSLTFGSDVYAIEKGNAILQANKLNIKVTSGDGTKIIVVYATLAGSLPIKTTEDPVKLNPGQDRKSATIQVLTDKWIFSFGGLMSRTA